jgi:hypothetical protein
MAARLERRPGLGRCDEERPVDVERVLQAPDRRRVGRVEDVEVLGLEQAPHHFGGETRSAHPEQDDVLDLDAGGVLHQLVDTLAHPRRLVQPAEPLRLVGARPDRRIAFPDPLDQLGRSERAQAETSWPRFARMPSTSSSNESMNFWTPSSSSTRVTSS